MVFLKTHPDQYDCGAGAFEAKGGGRGRVGVSYLGFGVWYQVSKPYQTPAHNLDSKP